MKRILILGIALMLCVGLVGCGRQVKDKNGESETGLSSLTDQELLKSNPKSVSVGSVKNQENGKTTWTVKKFSGVEIVDTARVQEGAKSVAFVADCVREKGNLQLYVCKDGELIGTVSIGQGASLTIKNPKPGKYELRMAGESAAFDLSATVTVNP